MHRRDRRCAEFVPVARRVAAAILGLPHGGEVAQAGVDAGGLELGDGLAEALLLGADATEARVRDGVPDAELAAFYAHADFTVYPSRYEGWGLPVAESLANGKMCIASDASSIPEIAGDLIDYFSPYDAQACLDRIVEYLVPKTLAEKEAQIRQQYKSTSWDDTFTQVAAGLMDL